MRAAADYLALIDPRWQAGGELAEAGERHDEYEDLRGLLLDGAPIHSADIVELACCVARACLGSDHLWHDLGLPSRTELSGLLHEHFPDLASRNVGNMRWKKFFYKELCEQVGIRACRAPTCGVCAQYRECFGSEDLPLAQLAA
jgi:nitrogen fixation protein NifQ